MTPHSAPAPVTIMKALTLTEPWATLMALREKTVETRSWKVPSNLLGKEVAIHSAKGFPRWAKDTCGEEPFRTSLGHHVHLFQPGHVLCIVKFIGCRNTEDVRSQLSEKEVAFGDYAEGRYAWFSEFIRRLDKPVPAVGHLGFWDWDGAPIIGESA